MSRHIRRAITPIEPEGYRHVWHQYTIRLTDVDREEAIARLKQAGVDASIFYPVPVHQQKVYRDRGYDDRMPVAEMLCRQVISLPVHPGLSQEDLDTIVAAVESL